MDINLTQVIPPALTTLSIIITLYMFNHKKNKGVIDGLKNDIENLSKNMGCRVQDCHSVIDNLEHKLQAKLSSLDLLVSGTNNYIVKESQEIRSIISEHKVDTISELKTRQIIEDKVEPIWKVLMDLKSGMQLMTASNNEILKAISRLEGVTEYRRRRTDEE